MMHAFNDAECLTLSAYSWPSRMVTTQISESFDYNSDFTVFKPTNFDLQYINPRIHRELLHTIVQADITRFRHEMMSTLAASFRCDASMDRVQKDNQFLLMKVMDKEGFEVRSLLE